MAKVQNAEDATAAVAAARTQAAKASLQRVLGAIERAAIEGACSTQVDKCFSDCADMLRERGFSVRKFNQLMDISWPPPGSGE